MSDPKVNVTKESLLAIFRKSIKLGYLDNLIVEIVDLLVRKNHDYSNSWQRYGIFTPLIRINDKILRIATLSTGEHALVAEEGIDNTLRDIVGYGILALLWIDNQELQVELPKKSILDTKCVCPKCGWGGVAVECGPDVDVDGESSLGCPKCKSAVTVI